MADKKNRKMVDFPEYNPDGRVPFPPDEGSPFGQAPHARGREPSKADEKPLYEEYDPGPADGENPQERGPGVELKK